MITRRLKSGKIRKKSPFFRPKIPHQKAMERPGTAGVPALLVASLALAVAALASWRRPKRPKVQIAKSGRAKDVGNRNGLLMLRVCYSVYRLIIDFMIMLQFITMINNIVICHICHRYMIIIVGTPWCLKTSRNHGPEKRLVYISMTLNQLKKREDPR